MNRPSVLWRLLMRFERRLPTPLLASVAHGSTAGDGGVTAGRPPRWSALAAMLPIIVLSLFQVVRHQRDLMADWPVWRPMIVDLTLLVAGAVLVAGIAFGVHAWRQAKRVDHA